MLAQVCAGPQRVQAGFRDKKEFEVCDKRRRNHSKRAGGALVDTGSWGGRTSQFSKMCALYFLSAAFQCPMFGVRFA